MEPRTKFCPDHRDLKPPPFADYCSVCNRRLVIHGHTYPDGADISPHFQADGITVPTPEEEKQIRKRMLEAGDLSPAAPEIVETLEEPLPKKTTKKGKK